MPHVKPGQFWDTLSLSLIDFSPSAPKEPEKEEEWKDEESDVVHLTDANFDEYLETNPSVMVMFYAPCK